MDGSYQRRKHQVIYNYFLLAKLLYITNVRLSETFCEKCDTSAPFQDRWLKCLVNVSLTHENLIRPSRPYYIITNWLIFEIVASVLLVFMDSLYTMI